MTYMLPVAELLSVGREPLERSIWANLRVGKKNPSLVIETAQKMDISVNKQGARHHLVWFPNIHYD